MSKQEKSPNCVQQNFYPYHYQRVFQNITPHAVTNRSFAKRLTTGIIYISVDRSIPLYICTFVRGSDVRQASSAVDLIIRLTA